VEEADTAAAAMAALAWGESLCGPLGESDEGVARRIAQSLVPLGTEEAALAARLFNQTGRR
jgi:hypothetical protein